MTEEEEQSSCHLKVPLRSTTRPDSPVPHKPVPSNRRVSRLLIEPLLKRPERIRNVCILAHVDHGKTTLTDSLLASNGIISFKQAGTLRYMDAREDEQERGITMESSAVSLLFDLRPAPDSTDSNSNNNNGSSSSNRNSTGTTGSLASKSTTSLANTEESGSLGKAFEGLSIGDRRFLVNLIDSPGHVDFSSQVATASKLCDGCLVLVDAVEGVCTQTAAVLRQAYKDRLTPCLVVNKMDRLVTELKLNTTEAAEWLFRLLAQVNAIQATVSQRNFVEVVEDEVDAVLNASFESITTEFEGEEVFSPARGNVIFASATDGWAFRIDQFARLHARRLEMKESVLQQTLWGEYYMDSKTKRVLSKKAAEKHGLVKPMFAQFILDNIWPVYEATAKDTWDQTRIDKIAHGLKVRLPLRELKTRDGRAVLRAIMTSWLPLADAAFAAIVDQLPNPVEAARVRVPVMFHHEEEYPEASQSLLKAICSGDASPDAEPTVAYLSKQFAVTTTVRVPGEEGRDQEETREKLIGMARVFHGRLSVGQQIYVLRPKFNPAHPEEGHYVQVTVKELFLLMGRDLEPVDDVYAGNVFGISGLEEHVGKSATLSSSLSCPSFDSLSLQKIVPIVRVAIHPANLMQMDQLVSGLHLLCQADPCAEMYLQEESGEYILAAAGELHLEQCLKDLRERFTKIEIEVSPPMVPFRETITMNPAISDVLWKEGLDENNGEGALLDGTIKVCTPTGNLRLGIKAVPLKQELIDFLQKNKRSLKTLGFDTQLPSFSDADDISKQFANFLESDSIAKEQMLALGPRRLGPNLLLAAPSLIPLIKGEYREFMGSILSGFQIAAEQGPLCSEPLMGVAFSIESIEKVAWPTEDLESCQLGNIVKGQLISTMKDACHRAFMFRSPRLMLATYSCDIQTTAEVLGRVYSVVARRLGTILSEEYNDGTGFFTVHSLIPVIESFGFADDIRGRTSGLAIPQLLFHGFKLLDQDPFWVPTTEEELEDFGEVAEKANVALRYLIGIRERKGMFVEKKIVQFAEKQRTLKK